MCVFGCCLIGRLTPPGRSEPQVRRRLASSPPWACLACASHRQFSFKRSNRSLPGPMKGHVSDTSRSTEMCPRRGARDCPITSVPRAPPPHKERRVPGGGDARADLARLARAGAVTASAEKRTVRPRPPGWSLISEICLTLREPHDPKPSVRDEAGETSGAVESFRDHPRGRRRDRATDHGGLRVAHGRVQPSSLGSIVSGDGGA